MATNEVPNRVGRNPVLLVHGIFDTVAIFKQMSGYLRNHGWSVYSLNLVPNFGIVSLDELAHGLADYIAKTFTREQSIDLIGFSMGGIVTRYYLQRLGGIERVQRYISISAPNHGTVMAYSLPFTGVSQMCPNSELLRDLNRDGAELLGKIDCTFMWTPFDLMIIPAGSSCMTVGKEVKLPVLLHQWMVNDERSLAAIATALAKPIQNQL